MDRTFIKAAAIRAARTFFQTFLATIGTATMLEQVRWDIVLSSSALAALLSIATSFVTGLPEVE